MNVIEMLCMMVFAHPDLAVVATKLGIASSCQVRGHSLAAAIGCPSLRGFAYRAAGLPTGYEELIGRAG